VGRKIQIGWGGTTETRWEKSGGQATLRFTDPNYHQSFLAKAAELLGGRWALIEADDSDPATRQRVLR
jgi:hypothetical protein